MGQKLSTASAPRPQCRQVSLGPSKRRPRRVGHNVEVRVQTRSDLTRPGITIDNQMASVKGPPFACGWYRCAKPDQRSRMTASLKGFGFGRTSPSTGVL